MEGTRQAVERRGSRMGTKFKPFKGSNMKTRGSGVAVPSPRRGCLRFLSFLMEVYL